MREALTSLITQLERSMQMLPTMNPAEELHRKAVAGLLAVIDTCLAQATLMALELHQELGPTIQRVEMLRQQLVDWLQ